MSGGPDLRNVLYIQQYPSDVVQGGAALCEQQCGALSDHAMHEYDLIKYIIAYLYNNALYKFMDYIIVLFFRMWYI